MHPSFYPHILTAAGYVLIPALILVPFIKRPPGPRPRTAANRLRWYASWIGFRGAPVVVPRAAFYLFAWFIFSCALDHAGHYLAPRGWALALAFHEAVATWTAVGYLASYWRDASARQRLALRQVLRREARQRRRQVRAWQKDRAARLIEAVLDGREEELLRTHGDEAEA